MKLPSVVPSSQLFIFSFFYVSTLALFLTRFQQCNGIFGVLSCPWGYLRFHVNLAQRLDRSFFISEMELVQLVKLQCVAF